MEEEKKYSPDPVLIEKEKEELERFDFSELWFEPEDKSNFWTFVIIGEILLFSLLILIFK